MHDDQQRESCHDMPCSMTKAFPPRTLAAPHLLVPRVHSTREGPEAVGNVLTYTRRPGVATWAGVGPSSRLACQGGVPNQVGSAVCPAVVVLQVKALRQLCGWGPRCRCGRRRAWRGCGCRGGRRGWCRDRGGRGCGRGRGGGATCRQQPGHIGLKGTDDVTRHPVVTHVGHPVTPGADAASQLGGIPPHHLGEVARLHAKPGVVEIVLGDL